MFQNQWLEKIDVLKMPIFLLVNNCNYTIVYNSKHASLKPKNKRTLPCLLFTNRSYTYTYNCYLDLHNKNILKINKEETWHDRIWNSNVLTFLFCLSKSDKPVTFDVKFPNIDHLSAYYCFVFQIKITCYTLNLYIWNNKHISIEFDSECWAESNKILTIENTNYTFSNCLWNWYSHIFTWKHASITKL